MIVIDDADAMNPNAANCLLKTLEEPLARNHLVLCTSAPDRLLPTIRSRTQQRPLPPAVGRASCWSWRAGTRIPAARAEIAATLADGSAARLFAVAAEEDDGAAAQTLAALRAAVVAPGRRARVRLRRRAGQRQGRQGGQGRPRHGCST